MFGLLWELLVVMLLLVVVMVVMLRGKLLVIVISVLLVSVLLLLDKMSTIGFEDTGELSGAFEVDTGGGQNERAGLPTDLRLKEMAFILGFCKTSVDDWEVETDVNELPMLTGAGEVLL